VAVERGALRVGSSGRSRCWVLVASMDLATTAKGRGSRMMSKIVTSSQWLLLRQVRETTMCAQWFWLVVAVIGGLTHRAYRTSPFILGFVRCQLQIGFSTLSQDQTQTTNGLGNSPKENSYFVIVQFSFQCKTLQFSRVTKFMYILFHMCRTEVNSRF
jgi:hypothetical protein